MATIYDRCAVKITFNQPMDSSSLLDTSSYRLVATQALRVLYAEMQDSTTVRIWYSADVGVSSLTTSNYTFSVPVGLPLSAVSVAYVTAAVVDVTVSGNVMTGENNYSVEVSNVLDIHSNALSPSYDSYTFNGVGIDPQVVSAAFIDGTHASVTFDQVLETTSAEDEDNYAISGVSSPTISSAVLSMDGKTVTLTLGTTLTNGSYTITASNVTNLIGCVVDADDDSATFTGVGLGRLPFDDHPTLTNGLLAYYQLDNTPNDYFTNSLDGSFPNGTPTLVDGKLVKGYSIGPTWDNPTLDTILLPASALFDNLNYCSISAWVNITSFAALNWHLIGGRYGQFSAAIRDDGTLYAQAYNAGGIVQTYSSIAIDAGSWYHIVVVWDGTYLKGFINGIQVFGELITTGETLVDSSGGNRWRLGCAQEPTGGATHSALTGELDEVGIWDRALTKSEIQDLYNNDAALSVDVIQPQVTSATNPDLAHIDVLFDKYVEETSAETAVNYAVTGASTPNVTVAALDADGVTAHLTLDADLINGAYTTTVSAVEDWAGNVIDPAHDSGNFNVVIGPFSNHPTLGTDLVSYYKLDSNALDAHTGGLNGGLTGVPTPSPGKIATCYDFNIANNAWPTEYMSVAANATFNAMTRFSVSCWIYLRLDAAGWWHQIVGRNESYLLTVVDDPGGPMDHMIYMGIYTAGGLGQFVTNGPLIYKDLWYHLVATYDGADMKIYLNGNIEKTEPHATPGNLVCNAVKDLWISGNSDGHSATNGLVDEVGLWNKALIPSEVADLYNSGSGLAY